MSIPPVPPANPDGPAPGEKPTPQYGQNAPAAPAAPQYGQNAPAAPQYGQNAPAAPQYGQVPPQYGKSEYGQSPYAQYPSGQPQGPSAAPKQVNTAFWLIVASGVVWVISLLVSLGALESADMRDMFEQQMAAAGGADVTFNDIKPFLTGTILVFAAIGAGLYALVALNIRKGKNWARILGTVFAALSVFSLFPLSLATLAAVLGIAGIVMLYLPANSPYFSKRQPFANPYGQPGGPY
ncbi:hypothetical protein ACX80S_03425 [Arthrobacter sp. RHLT1-20]